MQTHRMDKTIHKTHRMGQSTQSGLDDGRGKLHLRYMCTYEVFILQADTRDKVIGLAGQKVGLIS